MWVSIVFLSISCCLLAYVQIKTYREVQELQRFKRTVVQICQSKGDF